MQQTYAHTGTASFIRWRYSAENTTTFTDVFKIDASGNLTVPGTVSDNGWVSTGDGYFSGSGSGLPFGSCYGNEIGWTQSNAAQNTWYAISDTDNSDGQLNLVTHDGSGALTVTKAGKYMVVWNISAEVSIAGKHVQVGIGVTPSGGSLTAWGDGANHFDLNLANSEIPIGGNAIISLSANDKIEIIIRTTDAGTPNLSVDHYNLSVVMVGG
jgi:hypothetical protein